MGVSFQPPTIMLVLRRHLLLASVSVIFGPTNVLSGDGEGKYIPLTDHLEPQSTEGETLWSQGKLLERWSRNDPAGRRKVFKQGSKGKVFAGEDKGFLSTRIDRHADDQTVREFLVSHEGKKPLTVKIGPTLEGINEDGFFDEMITQISQNINKPEYTKLMQSDFSQSKAVDRVVANMMLMFSFQEYFEYRALLACGIPGVIMEGKEEDWRKLVVTLENLERTLQPLVEVLDLGGWFTTAKVVLNNLLETFQGNPDTKWWSRIFDRQRSYGSGGGKTLSGWFVTDFMGIHDGKLENVPSGLNVVPLTLIDGNTEEQAALVAGVTGYTLNENETAIIRANHTYPSIQTVHGWGLLLNNFSEFN